MDSLMRKTQPPTIGVFPNLRTRLASPCSKRHRHDDETCPSSPTFFDRADLEVPSPTLKVGRKITKSE